MPRGECHTNQDAEPAQLCTATSRSEEEPEMNLPNFPEVDLFSAGINAPERGAGRP